MSIGLKAVWKSHDDQKPYKANLYTLHSMIGLSAVVLLSQNFLLGLLNFGSPFMSEMVKKVYKPNHIFMGVCTLIMAVMAITTGKLTRVDTVELLIECTALRGLHLLYVCPVSCLFICVFRLTHLWRMVWDMVFTGVQEKNGFSKCGYTVDEKDTNPANNYHKLPDGCKMSNGVGICAFITLLLTLW